ncbi:MAG: sigma-70 family RNA polymerase sigma factor [Planctomycetales bacterium]|nr:sigma-70 family RNA polymerase sigma factor [Planctomycetales bacterium]MBN8627762.1 sigma-70 family RNA polymerase sigma factor [Planctomycetota bacterium]
MSQSRREDASLNRCHPFRTETGRDSRHPGDANLFSLRSNSVGALPDEAIRDYCRRVLLARGQRNAEHDALDARQDYYVKLLDGDFDKLDPNRNPAAFARAALRNLCIDQLRKQRRRPVEPLESDVPERTADGESGATERRLQLRRALRQLAARDRRLMLALYWLKWPRERVAARFRLAPATIPALASRVRGKLRLLLGGDVMNDSA